MTAPTQPPDPRVQRIADALCAYDVREMNATEAARVLVEELGGREEVKFATADDDMRIDGWNKVCQALWSAYPNMNAAMQAAPVHDRPALAIRQFAAQQRENAETIQALRERVATAERVKKFLSDRLEHHLRIQNVCAEQQGAAEMRENWANIRANKEAEISRGALIQKEEAIARAEAAERANTELDNARKSAEQSARDLRENNATLRAELDAIKGAQEPWATVTPSNDGWSFKQYKYTKPTDAPFNLYRHPAPPHNPFAAFIDALKADRDMQWYYHCNVAMAACDKGVPHDQANAAAFLFMERLLGEYTPLHAIPEYTPAPALPVVGACVIEQNGEVLAWTSAPTLEHREMEALDYARNYGGEVRHLHAGAIIPKEYGK